MTIVSEEEMIESVRKFDEFKKIAESIQQSIRLLYVFKNRNPYFPYKYEKENYIYINKTDEVRIFGENSLGCLGVTNGRPVDISEMKLHKEMTSKGITSIYNGAYHVFACNDIDEVYCWGSNRYGQLGICYFDERIVEPQKHSSLSGKRIVDISCGDLHSLALTESGEIYAWGDNKFGQVGIKGEELVLEPRKIKCFNVEKWVKIAAGGMHSMALDSKGHIYCWGHNNCGQLGTGSNSNSFTPLNIKLDPGTVFDKISCGQKSSFAITKEGDIYIFGKTYFKDNNFKENQDVPEKYQLTSFKLTEIVSLLSCNVTVALADNDDYYEFDKKGIKHAVKRKDEFKSFADYFAVNYKVTNKAIRTRFQRTSNPQSMEIVNSSYPQQNIEDHASCSTQISFIWKEINELKNFINQNLKRPDTEMISINNEFANRLESLNEASQQSDN